MFEYAMPSEAGVSLINYSFIHLLFLSNSSIQQNGQFRDKRSLFVIVLIHFVHTMIYFCPLPLLAGVGIVLITVSGIAWRLTSSDSPSCAAMLGIGGAGFCGLMGGLGGDEDYANGGGGRFLTRPGAGGGGAFRRAGCWRCDLVFSAFYD